MKKIEKAKGVTPTERLLAQLCEKSFLKLWSYPNPFKDDGKELCDLLAIFENQIFIFFDRENNSLENENTDTLTNWKRWKKKVIDAQIKTARGAERYIQSERKIYLDPQLNALFPIKIDYTADLTIHKVIIAHGAKEACEKFSIDNVFGSLGMFYASDVSEFAAPFMLNMDKENPVHVFDSHNLPLIFEELDTVHDFSSFLNEKSRAIQSLDLLCYCGEEDLLAHYFMNFDEAKKAHYIGSIEQDYNALMIEEGSWAGFIKREEYIERKKLDADSYFLG